MMNDIKSGEFENRGLWALNLWILEYFVVVGAYSSLVTDFFHPSLLLK